MPSDEGLVPTAIPHVRFALVLCMGKFLDGLSTLFVLQFRTNVYESVWLTRTLMEFTDPYMGTILITLLSVTVLMIFAILLDLGRVYLPEVTGRDTICYWGALSIYIGGTGYYVYATINNLQFLL